MFDRYRSNRTRPIEIKGELEVDYEHDDSAKMELRRRKMMEEHIGVRVCV